MKETIRTSAVMLGVMTVLTGLIYPAGITLVAQAALPWQANGSLIEREGKPIGSRLIGQPFTKAEYFWGRLSATSPVPYNAAFSSGSNLGPLNPALVDKAQSRIEALRSADPQLTSIPVDLVTASGSGLDPHISPPGAAAQVARVARARGRSEDEIHRLVQEHTEARQFGLLGEPCVNVLSLNLALDASSGRATGAP
jgi:K+-transporting ATPase ATPase C chain